jgi:RNA polymerase sigma factor (sigma-70 family)
MLFDDEVSGSKKSADDESQRNLEKIVREISERSFSKYSLIEDQVISRGKSIYDVIQDKLFEFVKRSGKPGADPAADSKWIDRNINQGKRKLYKYAENNDSINDDNFNPGQLAEKSGDQSRLEKYEIIRKVLNNYNARNKQIIALSFYVGLENREIAKKADTTEGNVRKVIHDFKKDCRKFGIRSSKSELSENIGDKNNGR